MRSMTPSKLRFAAVTFLLSLAVSTGGCGPAAMHVRPWDRDLLAEKKMSFVPVPMVAAIDDHIYFSKEGSTGGLEVGGGGCGCN
jgi:hypothetical protein